MKASDVIRTKCLLPQWSATARGRDMLSTSPSFSALLIPQEVLEEGQTAA